MEATPAPRPAGLEGQPGRGLSIHPRFSGLPGVAHGGYTGGLLAATLGAAATEVRLRRPVPVGNRLSIIPTGSGRVELRDGETLLSEGAATGFETDLPDPPSPDEALAASAAFPGHRHHPCPGCYACGTERLPGEGLLIRPGPLAGRRLLASLWTPPAQSGSQPAEVGLPDIWAAFDCAQLWALIVLEKSRRGERAVTARLSARIYRPVRGGVPHVLVAWPLGRQGDSFQAGAALFDPAGRPCVVGVQTAVSAKWGVPLDLND